MLNRSGMRLLDLVQQQHGVRMLVDRVGQQAALVEADIARRRADQARDRVPLHVFGHVEADQLDAQGGGQLPRHLGLADAGRAAEQVVADRLLRLAQPGAGQLDRRGQRLDRLVLAEHHRLQVALQIAQRLLVVGRDDLRRNARDLGDDLLDVLQRDGLPPLVLRQQHPAGADLVDHVDRLVRQLAVVDVFRRQLDRGADRLVGVAHLVVLLVVGLQAAQDLDRVFERRLVHVDLLEPPHQRAVLLEVVAELLVGGAADAAQSARRQRRLQQVRRIHRPAAGRAGADHGVDLVDEQDGAGLFSSSVTTAFSRSSKSPR